MINLLVYLYMITLRQNPEDETVDLLEDWACHDSLVRGSNSRSDAPRSHLQRIGKLGCLRGPPRRKPAAVAVCEGERGYGRGGIERIGIYGHSRTSHAENVAPASVSSEDPFSQIKTMPEPGA